MGRRWGRSVRCGPDHWSVAGFPGPARNSGVSRSVPRGGHRHPVLLQVLHARIDMGTVRRQRSQTQSGAIARPSGFAGAANPPLPHALSPSRKVTAAGWSELAIRCQEDQPAGRGLGRAAGSSRSFGDLFILWAVAGAIARVAQLAVARLRVNAARRRGSTRSRAPRRRCVAGWRRPRPCRHRISGSGERRLSRANASGRRSG